ncbi:MAG: amidohydrolase [Gemmatimonadales bacterium]|nr:MAG: amidohydrolase [Gemmatimonadales bacterium]
MRRTEFSWLVFFLLYAPGAAAQQVSAFVGVNVIPMDRERVLQNQTVVVRDGNIVALGPAGSTPIPQGALRIDGTGKYLLPGLAEMHAHIPVPEQDPEYTERVLFLYVANGVTTARSMLGHPSHLELRRRVEAGEIVGPRLWTSGPSASGNSVRTPAQADSLVRAQKAFGYDFVKIHPGLSLESFEALDRAADEVGIKFAGHVPTAVGVRRALAAGYWSIDHLDGYMHAIVADGAPVNVEEAGGFFGIGLVDYVDESKIPAIARATREAGVWNVPTQTLMENLASETPPESLALRQDYRYMPRQFLERSMEQKRNLHRQTTAQARRRFIELRRKLLKALHDAGAGLLLGSDAPQWWNVPGFSALRELEAVVAAGLTPYQALETATRNVAVFLGAADRQGTIEVGKRADLLLLDANPLENIANVHRRAGVMIRGRWLSREAIEQRLAQIASAYASQEPE